ncbi:MAG: ATPase [Clostridiales bacterium]|nr:ATPase [Clostridiales bacterium]
MDEVLKLLDELEEIIDQSRRMPLSNKITIEKEEILEIITEIRLRLPNDLKQARWIIQERSKILMDAQKEIEEREKSAEDHMRRMVDESEVTKRALDQAADIVEKSKEASREMRRGANEYADQVLAAAEESLRNMMESLRNENQQIEDFFSQSINIIYENRQELKGK